MCPFYGLRGRQAHGGRPRGQWQCPAAAKISDRQQRRADCVVHVDAPASVKGRCASETFNELNRTASPRTSTRAPTSFERFDAAGAILSAQYDGLAGARLTHNRRYEIDPQQADLGDRLARIAGSMQAQGSRQDAAAERPQWTVMGQTRSW